MIINNKMNYLRPLPIAFKAQNVNTEASGAMADKAADSGQSVSFIGQIASALGKTLDKVYENSTSSEVKASLDLIG